MANERKTEAIVRSHFEKFNDSIIIEEQQSDNPKINKLLKSASKHGNGKGYPEFIIQYKNNPDLIIVVECKPDTSKHESLTRDKFKDYAVDGALLYSSHLSKDFDVISIAVSGDSDKNVKITHFLQVQGESTAKQEFGDTLLPPEDYMEGYLKSPEKFRQDYEKLLTFSKELNDKLHSEKIVESDRSLLISCILIALENKPFLKSYKDYDHPEDLAAQLVETAIVQFKNGSIQEKKLNIIKSRINFISTDTSLSTKEHVLRDIIADIDNKINKFIRTHEYFDVLGQLYIEFLRYANSDKGLGIVLTPPHITEFMAQLAEVNKDSVVYDSCTGTGGFLVSAMNLMVKDAKDDQSKIKQIKQKQLIGVEYQAHIFALACSNMFIHQDGKSSIFNGSCFDEEIKSEVKSLHPTVGLLNPPYKSDKKKDTEELEFVLSNLECLEQGGKCVAIIPMQAAIAQKGKVAELKKKLLEKHTLEAVFSMPDELFFNSKVGVVSCIMVFTAKRPHPASKKTYFGYYKNDGFTKRKTKGRIDLFGQFEKTVKELWISSYFNKEEIAGLSVNRVVTADDEWCAEAYMESDYTKLNENSFTQTVLDFITYQLSSRLTFNVSSNPFKKDVLKITDRNWSYFDLNNLFTITGSKTTPLLDLEEFGSGINPYVTTQATNNGVDGFYNHSTERGDVLTVDSAVLGYCSYQPMDFAASDHVEKLIPLFEINKYIAMFLVTVINLEQYRYNYGRKASQARMKTGSISLPTNSDNEPDFDFMENYIKSLPYSGSL